jgi:L(+)-tartrate dehydratase beta subunit
VSVVKLSTPIRGADLEGLSIGDIVYLSGALITARDDVHHRYLRQGVPLPVDLAGLAIFHAGPIMQKVEAERRGAESGPGCPVEGDGAQGVPAPLEIAPQGSRGSSPHTWKVISIGPTTSMRMEQAEAEFIGATGLRLIVGKGGMGAKTAEACRKYGAVHTVFPGGCAVLAAAMVEAVERVEWLDLGMPEALWVMRVKEFGPLIVSIDVRGNNLFENNKKVFAEKKEKALAGLCGPDIT